MKKILLLLSICSNCYAFEEIWKSGESFYPLKKDIKKNILISKNCPKNKCEALKILEKVSVKGIDPTKFIGGKNPGSVICSNFHGQNIILKDLQGNENSFCIFEDKSFISNSSLTFYANKNDEN